MTTTSNTNGYVISSDKVEGTAIYNGAGDKLGSVDDLMIDKRSGHIRYPIPWNVLRYDTEREEAPERAPRYRLEDAPVYDQDYAQRIDRYYSMDA